jgi:hypothetical protein
MASFFKYSLLYFVFFSCTEKKQGEQKTTLLSNFLSISDNEDKGVKAVLASYDGYCEYSLGTSVGSGKGKYFKLKLSKSDLAETYKTHPQILASGIAYTFYSKLTDERSIYSDIHTQLTFNDGKELSFEYPVSTLEKISAKMNTVDMIVQSIKSQQFDSLKLLLDNKSTFKYNKDELIGSLKKIDTNFGNIQSFVLHGYKIDKLENGTELLHIMGVLKRDKQNHEFRVDMDLNSKLNQAFMVDYKFDYSDLF